MPQDGVKHTPREEEYQRLEKLEEWLDDNGLRRGWFAHEIGYTRASAWSVIAGRAGLSDSFVLACFNRFPDLPPGIFEEKGYLRDGEYVYKLLPLEATMEASV